jgi:cytochrome oxidase Cu insertion factor (SCO1/SenC/PrrC family)
MRCTTTFLLVPILLISAFSGCIGEDHEDVYDFHGMEYNPASPAPDFTLTDQDGHNVSLSDYDGKVIVLAFTYTSCPDVCLAIEANLHYINGEMSDNDDLVILSMTIDPARDSPGHLLEWTTQRGYDWTHLTSENHSQLSQVWTSYNLFVDTSHINSDHSDHSSHSNMSHQVSLLYPDNSTALLDGYHDMLPVENATGWNLTESTLSMNNISLNYSVHETFGHSVTGINDIDSPSDWSWSWVLHIWNASSEAWEESTTGVDEVMIMQDTGHVAWAASNANLSLLPMPENSVNTNDDDDSHDHDEVGGGEEMYEVGHNTLTYIIDKDGNKRLIYTGDDWSTADFMEDLTQLLHHDTGAAVDDAEHS